MSTGSKIDDSDATDDIASTMRGLQREIEQLRAEISRLTEENRVLREGVAPKKKSGGGGGGSGSGGTSGGGESGYERLRKKSEAQRTAKRRRIAAREAARPTIRARGKRSPRPPFVHDEFAEFDIPRGELPNDAMPNGYIDRRFLGVRIGRHNVLVRLHVFKSATLGRIVAKLPEGWFGEFTADTRVAINTLSVGGMTEPKIRELFADCGVKISAGHVNNILLATADALREEQRAAHRAGMENSPVVGIDGTHSTCDGEPMACHLIGNDAFTTLATTPHKDRVSVIGALAGEPVGHRVGEYALAHPGLGVAAREVLRRANAGEPVLEWGDRELIDLSHELRTEGLDDTEMDRFLSLSMPAASEDTLRHMREATAGQWLRTILAALPHVMLTDGGTNYHGILATLQLCWIHMLRAYSLLAETVDSERVLREGFVLYRRICEWRAASDNTLEAAAIEAEFDRVFDPERCDDTQVQHQLRLTIGHKQDLLTVLRHPYTPPENNGQERAAKARVRKRDISFGPRSKRGLRAWDTMQSVVGTLRKLKISPSSFLADRITHGRRFERLDVLVTHECIRRYGSGHTTWGV